MRFLPAFAAAAAIFAHTAQAEGHITADTVVATVGDTEITLAHMIVLRATLPQQYQTLPPELLFQGVLDQLVQQQILSDTVEALSKGSQATLDNETRSLGAAEAIAVISADALTEDAVQAAYDTMVDGVSGEKEWKVSHILFTQEDGMAAGVAEEEARAAIVELNDGANFEELARAQSDGPSGPSGGALGWYAKDGQLVAEFENAMSEMDAGTISAEPVQTQFGWHILRVEEVRNREVPGLDELRPQIEEQISRQAIEETIEALSTNQNVTRMTADEIDPEVLNDLSLLED